MKPQIIIESTQYINGKEFCSRYQVSPKKLQQLISEGFLGGIRISGVLYLDVSKKAVIGRALAYKNEDRSYYSKGGGENYKNPKYANDFDRRLEENWRESMGM
jgi:hypothetical protein